MPRKTTEQFIKEAKKIHGDKYDYSLVEYINNYTKVKIICKKHGIFEQQPKPHLYGQGCKRCYKSFTLDDFINKSKQRHNDKYDYSLSKYINDKTSIKIICPEHGMFDQTPNVHYNHGCSKCYIEKQSFSNDDFIKRSNIVHNHKYDYSEVNYITIKKYIKIICPKHGEFNQLPYVHLRGNGCPKCKKSNGENMIENFLLDNNIHFMKQKKFKNCKDKRCLPFDFYLPEHNYCVEFDGKQHFESVKYWGGILNLEYRQRHDEIKDNFCIINNINLLRIKYDDNINEKLHFYLSTLMASVNQSSKYL